MTLTLPARARTFPLGVSIGGVLTSFIILFSSFRRSVQPDEIAKKLDVDTTIFRQRLGNIIAWLGGYFICSWLLGVEYALPLVSFLYLKFYNKEGWFISTIITLSLIGLLFGLFGHVLNVFWIEGKLFKISGLIF